MRTFKENFRIISVFKASYFLFRVIKRPSIEPFPPHETLWLIRLLSTLSFVTEGVQLYLYLLCYFITQHIVLDDMCQYVYGNMND
jgi:hypothetical protein